MDIIALGDSAAIVRVREKYEDAPEETLDEVLRVFQLLQRAAIPGVIELAPAYTSVAVFCDPVAILKSGAAPDGIFDELAEKIQAALTPASGRRRGSIKKNARRLIEIPVCYDPDFGIDLDRVAAHAKLSEREVIDLHSGGEYRVACIGFVPGFTFLAGLPENLATPRRDVPRKEIPPGSVGIGGAQTGIYPLRSPGGWNLIGRTPLKLFDAAKSPPTLLTPADRVRFRAITRDEFELLKNDTVVPTEVEESRCETVT